MTNRLKKNRASNCKTFIKMLSFSLLLFCQGGAYAEKLSMQQVLQRVMDHYPSIKSAALQVQKAREENIKAESQLFWLLNANAGFARQTSLFGTASDRYSMGAALNRNLDNGGLLGFNANLAKEDAEDTFGPTVPNPSTKTRFDVNYRHRLQKGADNPQYAESKVAAKAGEQLAQSDELVLYDSLANQVIELYLSAATTRARINSIDKTIERGLRLKKYIDDEFKLGLSEEKDVLQVNARLSINEADKKSLLVVWQQQLISLNRLMGRQWDKDLLPDTGLNQPEIMSFDDIYFETQKYSPALKGIEARLLLTDSAIRRSRDEQKDQLDLVMFLGNEFNQGDTSIGDLDESELIGGLSLEFNRGLDKSGLNAALRQAHFDRGVALQDKKQLLEDIQYNVASLLAEIKSSEQALNAFRESVTAERKKLDEATLRYKDGRIETDRIIDFESQLATAELSYDLQTIELSRRYHKVNLLRGSIWEGLILPSFTFDEYQIDNQSLNKQNKNDRKEGEK